MTGAPERDRASVPMAMVLVVVAVVILAGGVVLLLAGGSGDQPAASVQGGLDVYDAWTTSGDTATAVYLTIDNDGADDRLVGAFSDAARSVQLMGGDVDMAGGNDDDGGGGSFGLDVPTGTTELQPGARHLMFVGLDAPLEAGTTVPLRLDLENAGSVRTELEVVTPDEAATRATGG